MGIRYKICPKCNGKDIVPIVFGFPSNDLFIQADQGKVKLGGCCVTDNNPEYYCNQCHHEWNKGEAIDNAYRRIKKIRVYLGGFWGPNYNVEIDLRDGQVRWQLTGEIHDELVKELTEERINHIIESLKWVNLLNWKRSYDARDIVDGTQWSIEIEREGRTLRKHGSNGYPSEWELFCGLIEDVTGKPFR